ncbi:MAG: hypothetical protein KAS17_11990 [Victivallaceae bacterium]|nr:hypothetical protein [Victivallaceae bacterium]
MEKVSSGKKFQVKASTWNSFIDVAAHHKNTQLKLGADTLRSNIKTGIILVRNDSDKLLEQFSPVILDNLIIQPDDAEKEQEFKSRVPVFSGKKVSADNKDKPFAILQVPLESGKIGKALIQGITPAKVNVGNESHQYAKLDVSELVSCSNGIGRILWKASGTGEKWALMQPGGGGSGGNNYSGFFQLIGNDDNENTVKVVDGSSSLANGICGIFVSGIDKITVPEKSLVISGESYIIFEAVYADEAWTTDIKAQSSFPEFTADKFTALPGIVKWNSDENAMGEIVQIWNNGIIYNNRYS